MVPGRSASCPHRCSRSRCRRQRNIRRILRRCCRRTALRPAGRGLRSLRGLLRRDLRFVHGSDTVHKGVFPSNLARQVRNSGGLATRHAVVCSTWQRRGAQRCMLGPGQNRKHGACGAEQRHTTLATRVQTEQPMHMPRRNRANETARAWLSQGPGSHQRS